MSTVTFNANASFDLKIVADVERSREIITDIEFVAGKEEFDKLPIKTKVFFGLVLEGKTEEERFARFFQYMLREALNDIIDDGIALSKEQQQPIKITRSPVKFRFVTND